MGQAIDLMGQRFGKLTVIERAGSYPHGQARWLLLCDCGNTTYAHTGGLRAGRHQSCSCGLSKPKHGMHKSRLHRIWSGMKARCSNPKKLAYADYGGRGIFVCEEWLKFIPFMEWAKANGYSDDLQLDRTDNDGPYSPANCRWVTPAENLQNKRPMRPLGPRYTEKELRFACDRMGIDLTAFLSVLPPRRGYR